VFSVVNAILLKPLPYPNAERIVFPWRLPPHGVELGLEERWRASCTALGPPMRRLSSSSRRR
jgi:hypothetical protein